MTSIPESNTAISLSEELLKTFGYEIVPPLDPHGPYQVCLNQIQWVDFATREAAIAAASAEAIRKGNLSQCQNCSAVHIDGNLKNIQDYHQRVEDDEEEPSGECPDCGCLCHWLQ